MTTRWHLFVVLVALVALIALVGVCVRGQEEEAPLLCSLVGGAYGVQVVAFSPDGATLASGSSDGIRLWNVMTGTVRSTLTISARQVYGVAFSPDGATLASGSSDNYIRLWGVASGRVLFETKTWVSSFALSPDGDVLAYGTFDANVYLQYFTPGIDRLLRGSGLAAISVAFSPDNATLASASDDNTIQLWSLETGRLLRTLSGHTDSVNAVVFSPDSTVLASGSRDKTVKLWKMQTGQLLCTLTGHTDCANSVAFSPDNATLASASDDNTIKLWDVETGQLLRTLTDHTSYVNSVAFSPDGALLASGSSDRAVKLWDVQAVLHRNQLPAASFSWQALSSSGARLVVEPRTGDRIQFDASGSSDPDPAYPVRAARRRS